LEHRRKILRAIKCDADSNCNTDTNNHGDSNAKIYSDAKTAPFTNAPPIKEGKNCGVHVAFRLS